MLFHDYIQHFVINYIDDILIYSSSMSKDLQQVKLHQHQLYFIAEKCSFHQILCLLSSWATSSTPMAFRWRTPRYIPFKSGHNLPCSNSRSGSLALPTFIGTSSKVSVQSLLLSFLFSEGSPRPCHRLWLPTSLSSISKPPSPLLLSFTILTQTPFHFGNGCLYHRSGSRLFPCAIYSRKPAHLRRYTMVSVTRSCYPSNWQWRSGATGLRVYVSTSK